VWIPKANVDAELTLLSCIEFLLVHSFVEGTQ